LGAENLQGNLNPVERVYSGASVLTCTPNAIASGGQALGTLATEARLRAMSAEAGLSRFVNQSGIEIDDYENWLTDLRNTDREGSYSYAVTIDIVYAWLDPRVRYR
jgi:hypothetical protein